MSEPILVDLHCHLLPGIDDGAANENAAVDLMRKEEADGVHAVMFTPHFYYERMGLDSFVANRKAAYTLTANACRREGIRVAGKLGAEVHFTPALPFLDLSKLCFSGTRYILVEFPTTVHAAGIEETLYAILQRGYTPILAHVERFPYISENPTLLYNWVTMGCLAQVNASGFLRGGETAKLMQRYLHWNLIHLLASDAHSIKRRPPNLKDVHAMLPQDVSAYFMRNGEAVFFDREPFIPEPIEPKKIFGLWK